MAAHYDDTARVGFKENFKKSSLAMEYSDEKLMQDVVKHRDAKALEIIMHRWKSSMWHYFYWRLRDSQRNHFEDLSSKVFLSLWDVSKYEPEDGVKFKSFIYKIASNKLNDFRRKESRREKKVKFESIFDSEEKIKDIKDVNEMEGRESSELKEEFKAIIALSALNDTESEVILLHYVDDFTFEEIAKHTDSNINTVKSRHRRALAKCEKIYSQKSANVKEEEAE